MHMRMDLADNPSGAVFPQAFHYDADIMNDKIPLDSPEGTIIKNRNYSAGNDGWGKEHYKIRERR
jgi:hypothetical protein